MNMYYYFLHFINLTVFTKHFVKNLNLKAPFNTLKCVNLNELSVILVVLMTVSNTIKKISTS